MDSNKKLTRPSKITFATNFYYTSVAMEAGRALIIFLLKNPLPSDEIFLSIKLIFNGFLLFLTYITAAGKNWPRIALLIILIIDFKINEKSIFANFFEPSLSGTIEISELALKAIALYLLFQNDSSGWFTSLRNKENISTLAVLEPTLGTMPATNVTLQEPSPPKHQLGQCPKCRCKIKSVAESCPHCSLNLVLESKKPILRHTPDRLSSPDIIMNSILGGLSLFMLLIGWGMALDRHGQDNSKTWAYACVFGMLIVIFSAIKLRVHWMLLITLGAVALGFSSCATNFHWLGA